MWNKTFGTKLTVFELLLLNIRHLRGRSFLSDWSVSFFLLWCTYSIFFLFTLVSKQFCSLYLKCKSNFYLFVYFLHLLPAAHQAPLCYISVFCAWACSPAFPCCSLACLSFWSWLLAGWWALWLVGLLAAPSQRLRRFGDLLLFWIVWVKTGSCAVFFLPFIYFCKIQ